MHTVYKTHNKRNKHKITIENLNNNYEMKTKWQPPVAEDFRLFHKTVPR